MQFDSAEHWEGTYARKEPAGVSWFEDRPEISLAMIEAAALAADAAILDVGGGTSRLAGELHRRGFGDITVADISSRALEEAQAELGPAAAEIRWFVADVRNHDFARRFDLWHDRAVFHFMVDQEDRDAYLATLRRSLQPGGHLVLATFGPEGPTSCSGLPVRRYSAQDMSEVLGREFELIREELTLHATPNGGEQQFQYALFRRGG